MCVNLLRKASFSEDKLQALVASFYARYPVFGLNQTILVRASQLRDKHALSFWDSLVVSTALHSSAPTLYSEDMQDGLVVAGRLKIVNPFGEIDG